MEVWIVCSSISNSSPAILEVVHVVPESLAVDGRLSFSQANQISIKLLTLKHTLHILPFVLMQRALLNFIVEKNL